MEGGASIVEFAASISVSRQTIQNWIDTHPEFLVAVQEGITKSQAAMELLGRAAMKGQTKIRENLWSFMMSRRFNDWKNKIGLEHTGANGGPIRSLDLSKLSDEDLSRLERIAATLEQESDQSGTV